MSNNERANQWQSRINQWQESDLSGVKFCKKMSWTWLSFTIGKTSF